MCASLYFGREESGETWAAVASPGRSRKRILENRQWLLADSERRKLTTEDGDTVEEKRARLDGRQPRRSHSQRIAPPITSGTSRNGTSRISRFERDGILAWSRVQQLYKQNELSIEELARLEWPFAQLFRDITKQYTNAPMALHQSLQKDPSFFAQLISFVHGREDDIPDASTEGIDETHIKRE